MRHKIERSIEEQIDSACKKILSYIPENLHCEDLYQDIACIYLEIYSIHPDYSYSLICNRIRYSYEEKLIEKYTNDKCNYTIIPKYNSIEDEDDMMFMTTDIFGIIRNFLTDREFDIICRRFIYNETFRYIGSMHGIGAWRTLQILNKAIRKLRHPKCRNLIQDFYR